MTYIQENSKTELHRKLEQIEIDAWQSLYVNINRKINSYKQLDIPGSLLKYISNQIHQ